MNIEQITSRLAQMPDQALQKYAMMHKEDPYIMALAISESRRRKQMRAASAAPQPQAQPKVADQALMEMGVDALPTQDMNFAGGGIVAFADGGDVEHYQVGGSTYETPYDRMNRLNREREEQERLERLARIEAEGGNTSSYGSQMGNVGRFFDQFVPDPRNIFKTLVSAPGYGLNKDLARPGPTDTGDEAKRLAARYAAPGSAAPAAPSTPAAPGAARTGTASAGAPREGGLGATPEAAAARKAAVTEPAAPSVQSAKDLAGEFYDTKAQKEEVEKYIKEQKDAVERARERREQGKPQGEAYSKYEQMLQAEGAKSGKERDDALSVAILQFGVGLMGGTSPNAFKNISDAAGPALGQYTSALKDLKKAEKERQKALADIENARRAEARDDWKAKNEFEDKAETRMDTARKHGIDFIREVSGKSAEIAGKIYDRQVTEQGLFRRTQMEQEGQTARTRMQTSALMARGANTEDKQTLNELKALQQSINEQLKSPRMMGPAGDPLRAQLQQINAAIAQMAGLGTMPGAPGAGSPGGIPPDVQALLNKYGGK